MFFFFHPFTWCLRFFFSLFNKKKKMQLLLLIILLQIGWPNCFHTLCCSNFMLLLILFLNPSPNFQLMIYCRQRILEPINFRAIFCIFNTWEGKYSTLDMQIDYSDEYICRNSIIACDLFIFISHFIFI